MSTDKDLPPTKYGSNVQKTGYHGITVPTSQIPGLSLRVNDGPEEERPRGRRVGVRESDSDYVKLAKQGGQKDLLRHEETVLSKASSYKPRSYNPPDWFCREPEGSNERPSLIKNGEGKIPGAPRLLDAPFGTENESVREWGDGSNGKKKRQGNIPNSQMEKLSLSTDHHDASKFKKMSFDKKPATVDMSKLLSFGYAEDNKPTPTFDMSN